MFKPLSFLAALLSAGAALAQTAPGQTSPSVTPSQTPSVAPSQTPSVTPSETPAVTPSQAPVIGGPAPAVVPPATTVGGMSQCQNMIGGDRDKCLQEERAATAGSGGRAAGAGGSHAPGSSGTGAGTMGAQQTAPAGSLR
jgi:hypothetical protein